MDWPHVLWYYWEEYWPGATRLFTLDGVHKAVADSEVLHHLV